MQKLLIFWVALSLFVSCDRKQNTDAPINNEAVEFNMEKLPPKATVNGKANAILTGWPEYNALDASFDALYRANNDEDLRLVIEDLIEKQKLLAESEFPEEFNKPQIESRQKVFRTFVLKTKGDLEYRKDPTESAIEMVNAYNAVRNQFNVIVNNTLDTKLILEE